MNCRLIKHTLEFNSTIDYFKDQIGCGKVLSKKILERIDFNKGEFFTLLPENANLEHLLKFSFGGIMPSELYGTKTFLVGNPPTEFHPKIFHTIGQELIDFTKKYLHKFHHSIAICDDFMSNKDDIPDTNTLKTLIYNDDDINYIFDKKNSIEEISQILDFEQVWHFLLILSYVGDKFILEDKIINEILDNARYIITNAYDGEGYIFWEPLQVTNEN